MAESLRKVHIQFVQSLKRMTPGKSFAIIVLSAFLLAACLVVVKSPAVSSASVSASDWTDHGVIVIDSDSKFTSANGVVSGAGSKSDPYIIEGWKIGPYPNRTAIGIHDTSAYFRIRNVYVFSCGIGVVMSNVNHGRVEDSQFVNNSVGVAVVESENCKVVRSTFEGSYVAISISYSDVSLSDNTYINNGIKVTRLKHTQPWEFTGLGAAACVAVFIPLIAIIAMLIYFRFKRYPPPVQ